MRSLGSPERAGRHRRRATAALLAALVLLAAAAVAAAPVHAADFVFKGRGYGHGVGLSQWGAWQAAKEGKDFRFILGFYYPGTSLEPLESTIELTVKLSSEPWKSVSDITQNFAVIDIHAVGGPVTLVKKSASGEQTEPLPAGSFCTLSLKDGAVQLVTTAGGKQGPYERVEARPGQGARVKVQFRPKSDGAALEAREYWGKMRVESSPSTGYIVAYNLVPIEKYLRSIAEVEYDWSQPSSAAYAPEAVNAQAVAARTYAVANRDPYLNDNQWDQVYRGYTWEQKYPGIGAAAERTAGLVLRYDGQVISSFFSSSSGGFTTAWDPGRYPYLPAKADPYSLKAPASNPGYAWSFTISQATLSEEVDGITDVNGKAVHVGTITRVEVLTRDTPDPASHAATLRITGSSGSATVTASALRRLFGYGEMRSTLFLEIVNPAPPVQPGEFIDVPRGHLYYQQIDRAVDEGLMDGYPDGTFQPETAVSRWQFAKMAVNLHNAVFPDDQIPVVDVSTRPFADVSLDAGILGDQSDWVAAALQAGLVNGVSATSFQPYEPVRRDQLASMLVRAMEWEDEAEALPDTTPGFSDVPAASPHAEAVAYLKSIDVLKGYVGSAGGSELRPAESTKRMHVAVILCRVLDRAQ